MIAVRNLGYTVRWPEGSGDETSVNGKYKLITMNFARE
jgi:hypothetical protein